VDVGIDPINQTIFQAIFGAIFTVIIALEFKHSLLVVLAQHENVIRVRTIVLIALLAIARKFILLDMHDVTAMELFALSAAVLALGVVYWLVREQDARVARDAREQAHLEDN
ncbi:phosphate-starvation-inducible PsiE family protein, partial [Acetobacter senegalensis]